MDRATVAAVAARARIAEVAASGASFIDLSGPDCAGLQTIPEQISRLRLVTLIVLEDCLIQDLAPLAGMDWLDRLELSGSRVSDLTAVAGMRDLRVLNANRTGVADLSPLAGLGRLQSLGLARTPISDLAPIAGLAGLADLSLDGSAVRDLRPLRHLSRLGSRGFPGLGFADTPATLADPNLGRLSRLSDPAARARETLAYLAALPH